MVFDVPSAVNELRIFIDLVRDGSKPPAPSDEGKPLIEELAESEARIARQAPMVEPILDRVIPDWHTSVPTSKLARWAQHREAAQRATTVLQRGAELRMKLGDDAPTINAARLHPWAWDGARSMWASRHHRQAVVDGLKKVNAEAQNKTGRHDLSETNLFKQVFSLEDAKPETPRLMADVGSDTFKSLHRGAMALAEGLFAGIRNVVSHTSAETDADEQRALEQLAAVSVLARWVDDARVETAP
ncbi:Protein of unknown function (Hypoth_ymh) [Geodermatophilus obscurus]|uniref:Conserved hypothetical protein CHP02391 domain-containing protein n=1 Tax=Geodermatophilus obscurus TaxID=1861 RepID=A0A1M7V1K7_9ACTN|nr:TIGR02391 family protein [Geodermatophilus obscurus]SHN89072.1 Protein of unknown function (Hypoth_ymh) [Geodermatophilus obscurus]